MRETVCQFGEQRRLAGIHTEPAGTPRGLACVFVNAGLVPKFGPFRLHVQLARRLAREGFRTLRFDLSDIGDSRRQHLGLPLLERTNLDIRAALDQLIERKPVEGVILGGLCSGAEDSFRYAEKDPRVTEVVLIDPFAYRTSGWAWRDLLFRLRRRTLRAVGLFEPVFGPAAAGPAGGMVLEYKYMDPGEARRILSILIERGVRIHFLYTGGSASFNHVGQLRAMFKDIDFKDRVTVDYLPELGHTQVRAQNRKRLIETICARLIADQ